MAKFNLVTPEIYKKILIDYKSNKFTLKQLSKKYKLSNVSISRHLKINGDTQHKDIKFDKIKKDIINDYINGVPPFILREKYKISRTRLKEITKPYRSIPDNSNTNWHETWKQYLSPEEFDRRIKRHTKIRSEQSKGKNNPMYGKPSPQGSGNGWKGWYNGIFFRSLRELSFMINYIGRFHLTTDPAEKVKFEIKYKDYLGQERNYYPDYLINNKFLVEIKPKRLWNTPLIIAKKLAAEEFCKNKGFKYKLIDPKIIDLEIIRKKVDNKEINFFDKYKEKFEKYYNKNKN